MHANIRHDQIWIPDVEPLTKEIWKSMLDELKAEHASWMPRKERVLILPDKTGQMNAYLWRNPSLSDEEVIKILAKYGIEGSFVPRYIG